MIDTEKSEIFNISGGTADWLGNAPVCILDRSLLLSDMAVSGTGMATDSRPAIVNRFIMRCILVAGKALLPDRANPAAVFRGLCDDRYGEYNGGGTDPSGAFGH
mgnify:CR=1 FL=1